MTALPGGGRFSVPGTTSQQLPCQQPPWGELTAVNVNTGEFAWRVPLGVRTVCRRASRIPDAPATGGTIATAGGLVFVAATDRRPLPRLRCEDRQGTVDRQAGCSGGSNADDLSGQGWQAVCCDRIDGRRFFNNPVTDDSIMAYAIDGAK